MSLLTYHLEHGRHVARLHRRRRRVGLRAIPRAMITMRKSIPLLSIPLHSMDMGLRLAAFGRRSSALKMIWDKFCNAFPVVCIALRIPSVPSSIRDLGDRKLLVHESKTFRNVS